MLIILKKFAWDLILKAIDDRTAGIEGEISKATSLRAEAEKVLKDYQDKVNHSRDEALGIINEAKSDANNLKHKMVDDANAEIRKMKEQSLNDIELAKAKAVHEMQIKIAELSVQIAGEILEKQLKKEDYSAFIDKELSKLESI